MTETPRRLSARWALGVLLLSVVASVILGMAFGAVTIPISETVSSLLGRGAEIEGAASVHRLIIREIRLPRVLLGFLVGSALAISGATMQGIFRNPLASPYVLGIASGASTGAALVAVMGWAAVPFLPLGAFLGGLLAAGLVYGLARARGSRRTSVFTLILAGVAVGALFSAITSFMVFLSSKGERMADIVFWIMGGLGRANWADVGILAPIVGVGTLIILAMARDLDALALGEEGAFHLGVDPGRSARVLLATTALLTAAAVAFAGTIGFVGLIVPHIVRLVLGPRHRLLLPASALAGGIFLAWADVAARTVMRPTELPVGIVTAFLGAPFFLFLLKRRAGGLR